MEISYYDYLRDTKPPTQHHQHQEPKLKRQSLIFLILGPTIVGPKIKPLTTFNYLTTELFY